MKLCRMAISVKSNAMTRDECYLLFDWVVDNISTQTATIEVATTVKTCNI
jgi:hypothetical protein